MPPKKRRIRKKNISSRIILVIILVLGGVFLLYNEFGREKVPSGTLKPFHRERAAKPSVDDIPSVKGLPQVAIVVDDLGSSRKKAQTLFDMKQPVTFSILPHLAYSRWTAEEAYRRGYDVILHIPMEAIGKMKLGKGGLSLYMSNSEIIETLENSIKSLPFIKGAGSHMGSAFTKDKRAMATVTAVLKEHNLFFLDSVTTPETVGYSMAKANGLKALRRDVFLDNTDDPGEIAKEWDRLVKIAKKEGYAIALGHPRKNTLQFLRKTLKTNKDVRVVPLSELLKHN